MKTEDNNDVPWWFEGLNFTCAGCGRCCRGEPGAIWITEDELRNIAHYIGVSEDEFVRRFTTTIWKRTSIKERSNGDCVFYDNETSRCTINSVKPAQCSAFPFWHSVLRTRQHWNKAAKTCLGMNDGELHDAEEIELILKTLPYDDL